MPLNVPLFLFNHSISRFGGSTSDKRELCEHFNFRTDGQRINSTKNRREFKILNNKGVTKRFPKLKKTARKLKDTPGLRAFKESKPEVKQQRKQKTFFETINGSGGTKSLEFA